MAKNKELTKDTRMQSGALIYISLILTLLLVVSFFILVKVF